MSITDEIARGDDQATQKPPLQIPCDGVFATAVLSPTRILATFYWARYRFYGKPLVLCDYEVTPLTGNAWGRIGVLLDSWRLARRSRLPRPIGLFVETEMIATQANEAGTVTFPIASWLTATESWHQIVQSAAGILARGDVGYTRDASRRMDQRPFLNEAGVVAGPRPEDPTAPAFLYGVILGLDPAAARDPHPKPPTRAARN